MIVYTYIFIILSHSNKYMIDYARNNYNWNIYVVIKKFLNLYSYII